MNYTQLFRTLREAKSLTHDGLAKLASCHRNTVINVESGRPVKFKTIAELMLKMGYDSGSSEMKSVALLWLESISGINLTHEQSTTEARERIEKYRATEREAAQLLVDAVTSSNLTVDQIRTLLFAAGRPEIIAILENVRQVVTSAETAPVVNTAAPMPIAQNN
jgi:DNA-binding XRE family transcriptional regulator